MPGLRGELTDSQRTEPALSPWPLQLPGLSSSPYITHFFTISFQHHSWINDRPQTYYFSLGAAARNWQNPLPYACSLGKDVRGPRGVRRVSSASHSSHTQSWGRGRYLASLCLDEKAALECGLGWGFQICGKNLWVLCSGCKIQCKTLPGISFSPSPPSCLTEMMARCGHWRKDGFSSRDPTACCLAERQTRRS